MTPRPSRPDHAADAGGDPDVLAAKDALRQEVWTALADAGADRFPGAEGRIPNFVGAEDAAERLRGMDVWRAAGAVKANPDSPQWPVRQRALEDGIPVAMAVPRLAEEPPFLLLRPELLEVSPRQASSIKGAGTHADPVAVDDLPPIDLVVVGCVAVDREGRRLGKGGGFADLELAIAHAAGVIHEETPIVATVHDVQVVEPGRIPMTTHDLRLDVIVTPSTVIEVERPGREPPRIHWDELTDDKIAAIPLLQRLHAETQRSG